MKLDAKELLKRLGDGESVQAVCAAGGLSRAEFDAWWQEETRARVPGQSGSQPAAVNGVVRIDRNSWGIPHISADTDEDLFFGFGYAMAQDRLFQLDYLRRKAAGRLSEILGPDGLDLDIVARTLGISRIAEAEWRQTPDETRRLVTAFSQGINAVIAATTGSGSRHRRGPSAHRVRSAGLRPRTVVAGGLPRHRRRVPRLPDGAPAGDLHSRAGQAHPRRGRALPRVPGGRGRRREHPAARIVSRRTGRDAARRGGGRRSRGRIRQQQLGHRRVAVHERQTDGGERSAHRFRCGVVLVRGDPDGWLVQRDRHGLRRDAGGDVRAQRARGLGHHEQHLLAT